MHPELFNSFSQYQQLFGPTNFIKIKDEEGYMDCDYFYESPEFDLYRDQTLFIIDFNLQVTHAHLIEDRMEDVLTEFGAYSSNILGWYTIDEPFQAGVTCAPPCDERTEVDSTAFYNFNLAIRDAERTHGLEPRQIFCTMNRLGYTWAEDDNRNLHAFMSDPNVNVLLIDKYPFVDYGYLTDGYHYPDVNPQVHFGQVSIECPCSLHTHNPKQYRVNFLPEYVTRARNAMESWQDGSPADSVWQKPIFVNPQGHGHKSGGNMYHDDGGVLAGNIWMRPPSYAESRYQVFSSIASGANGVLPWAANVTYEPNYIWWGQDTMGWAEWWMDTTDVCNYQYDFWVYNIDSTEISREDFFKSEMDAIFANFKAIFTELDPLSEIIIRGNPIDSVAFWSITAPDLELEDSTNIRTLLYEHADVQTLIAVNTCDKDNWELMGIDSTSKQMPSIDVHFDCLALDSLWLNTRVTCIDPYEYNISSSELELSNQQPYELEVTYSDSGFCFDDHFGPGEVHIYKFSNNVWDVFPNSGPTLTEVISYAGEQDTILVHGGTWINDYSIDKNLVILGQDNVGFPSIYGSGSSEAAVTVGSEKNVVFCDFTIIGGSSRGILNHGDLTLEDCTIDGCNYPSGNGGGIYITDEDGSLYARNTTFQNNTAEYGGAIYNAGSLTLLGCLAQENTATENGGGIYSEGLVDLNFDEISGNECIFGNNYAPTRHLLIDYSGTPIRPIPLGANHTRFVRDLDDRATDPPPPTEKLVQVTTNQPYSYTTSLNNVLFVDGRYCSNSRTEIEHSTFAGFSYIDGGGDVTFSNSILMGDDVINDLVEATYSRLLHAPGDSSVTHNTEADPLFVDPDDFNFHIRWDSPCLDQGNPTSPLDYDHTRCDMGYHRIYRVVELPGRFGTNFALDKGWYLATEDVSGSQFVLPPGSVVRAKDGVKFSFMANLDPVMIGAPDDERTSIVADSVIDMRGTFSIQSLVSPPNTASIHHLLYADADAQLHFINMDLSIDDLRFENMRGGVWFGSECTGLVENCLFTGEAARQVDLLDNDVVLRSCDIQGYSAIGIRMHNYIGTAATALRDLQISSPSGIDQVGIVAVNCEPRLEACVISGNERTGIHAFYSSLDMARLPFGPPIPIAHNDISDNDYTDRDQGQIWLDESLVRLYCGYNRITYTGAIGANDVFIRDDSDIPELDFWDVRYNDWGVLPDPGDPTPHLPESWNDIWWNPTAEYDDPNPSCPLEDPAAGLFASAYYYELLRDTTNAIAHYADVIKNYPTSPYASSATWRMKNLGGKRSSHGGNTMDEFAMLVQEVGNDNADLQYLLSENYWELYGIHHSIEVAIDSLTQLATNTPDEAARIYYELGIAYLEMIDDSPVAQSTGGDPAHTITSRVTHSIQRENDYIARVEELLSTHHTGAVTTYPTEFSLSQNYPNPFNPITTIEFAIPVTEQIKISIYNILGQRVEVLLDERRDPGLHTIQFDASRYASGVYFYRMQAGKRIFNRKMMVLK